MHVRAQPLLRCIVSLLSILAACAAMATSAASAQDYPTRPLRLVVPFAPGGATDILGRLGAQKLSELLGQQVVIENKPGGGTLIGTRDVLNAPADGYTLLLAVPTIPIMAAISKSANYRMSDLTPISSIGSIPYVLSVSRKLPVTTLAEFVAHARANAGKLNAGVVGTGSASTLVADRFKKLAGINVVDVPYTSVAASRTPSCRSPRQARHHPRSTYTPSLRCRGDSSAMKTKADASARALRRNTSV